MLYFLCFLVAGIYYLPLGIYAGWKIFQYAVWMNYAVWIETYKELNLIIKKHCERIETANRR